jgi:hypothetical protein
MSDRSRMCSHLHKASLQVDLARRALSLSAKRGTRPCWCACAVILSSADGHLLDSQLGHPRLEDRLDSRLLDSQPDHWGKCRSLVIVSAVATAQ